MDINAVRTIGVVGCGLMGAGIVETCARAGYSVIVREVNDDFLAKGLKRVQGSLARNEGSRDQNGKRKDAKPDFVLHG